MRRESVIEACLTASLIVFIVTALALMTVATEGIFGRIFGDPQLTYHSSMKVLEVAYLALIGMVMASVYIRVKTDPRETPERKADIGRDAGKTFLLVGITLAAFHLLTELAKRI